MQKFSRVFQVLFRWLLTFTVAFVWARYFIHSLWQATLIATAVSVVFNLIFRVAFNKKSSVSSLKKQERENAENAFLSLSMDVKAMDFFATLASKTGKAEKKKNCVVVEYESGKKTVLIPFLSHKNLSCDEIAAYVVLARKYKANKIVIICESADKECFSFAKNFDEKFVILNQYEAYEKLYKAQDCFPPITIKYKKEKALAFKELAMFSLNKSRAKGYFISALVLVVSSIFVRSTIYYCVVASLLLIMAAISLCNPFAKNAKCDKVL